MADCIHPIEDLVWFYGGGAEADTGYVSVTGPQIEALQSGGGTRRMSSDSLAAELVQGWVSPPTPTAKQVQSVAKLRRIYHAVCQLEGAHQAVLQLAYAQRSYTEPDRRGCHAGDLSYEDRLAAPHGYRDRHPRSDKAFGRLYEDGRTIESQYGLAAGPVLWLLAKAGRQVERARREVARLKPEGGANHAAAKAALTEAEKAAKRAPERAVRLLREAHLAYEAVGRQRRRRREQERKERAQAWWDTIKRQAEAKRGCT